MTYVSIIDDQLEPQFNRDLQYVLKWLDANGNTVNSVSYLPRSVGGTTSTKNDQTIEEMLQELNFDYTRFTLKNYIDHVAAHIGRHLELVPFDLSVATTGMCVRTKNGDFIFFNENRHRLLQEHIVIHETAHLLFGHQMLRIKMTGELADLVGSDVDVVARLRTYDNISHILDEASKLVDSEQEREAEAFAREFLTQVQVNKRQEVLKDMRNSRLFPPFN
ncbi:MAG: hypothetical protein AAF846_22190 [Chloroflexota bacterium]